MDRMQRTFVIFALAILVGTAFLAAFATALGGDPLEDARIVDTVAVKWPWVPQSDLPTVPMSFYFETEDGYLLNHDQAVSLGLSRKRVFVEDRDGDPIGLYGVESMEDGTYDVTVWTDDGDRGTDEASVRLEGLGQPPDGLTVRIDSEVPSIYRSLYDSFRNLGIDLDIDEHDHFVTDVVQVDDVDIENAVIRLPTRGEPASVWIAEDFDLTLFEGRDWTATRIPFMTADDFVEFEVDHFGAYAVSKEPMPDIEHVSVSGETFAGDEDLPRTLMADPSAKADADIRILDADGRNAWEASDGALVVGPDQTLRGNGEIDGDVLVSGGVLSPGNSPGIVTIAGDLTISDGDGDIIDDDYTPPGSTGDTVGTLYIEIGGETPGPGSPVTDDGYDQIRVQGDISLGGKMIVDLINSYEPSVGETFDFLLIDTGYTGAITGDFSDAEGLFGELPGDRYFEIVEDTDRVYLEVKQVPGGSDIDFSTGSTEDDNSLGKAFSAYFSGHTATVSVDIEFAGFVDISGSVGVERSSGQVTIVASNVNATLGNASYSAGVSGGELAIMLNDSGTRAVYATGTFAISGGDLFGAGGTITVKLNDTGTTFTSEDVTVGSVTVTIDSLPNGAESVSGVDLQLSVSDFVSIEADLGFAIDGTDVRATADNVDASVEAGSFSVGVTGGKLGLVLEDGGAMALEASGTFSMSGGGFASVTTESVLVRFNDTGASFTGTNLDIDGVSYTFADMPASTDLMAVSVTGLEAGFAGFLSIGGDFGFKMNGGRVEATADSAYARVETGTFSVGVSGGTIGFVLNSDDTMALEASGTFELSGGSFVNVTTASVTVKYNDTGDAYTGTSIEIDDVSFT
ncbi:MAG: hypothetical protein L0Z54_06305, partial [Thermoplasmata archaeon]|nr:hypothetical protein [Thermoplasmata archaeon]